MTAHLSHGFAATVNSVWEGPLCKRALKKHLPTRCVSNDTKTVSLCACMTQSGSENRFLHRTENKHIPSRSALQCWMFLWSKWSTWKTGAGLPPPLQTRRDEIIDLSLRFSGAWCFDKRRKSRDYKCCEVKGRCPRLFVFLYKLRKNLAVLLCIIEWSEKSI